jgi:hypothetical protein
LLNRIWLAGVEYRACNEDAIIPTRRADRRRRHRHGDRSVDDLPGARRWFTPLKRRGDRLVSIDAREQPDERYAAEWVSVRGKTIAARPSKNSSTPP